MSKMKDDNKKAQALSMDESWAVRIGLRAGSSGRSLIQKRLVYAVCAAAVVWTLVVLSGPRTSSLDKTSMINNSKNNNNNPRRALIDGPKKQLTPEETRALIAKIDIKLKRFLKNNKPFTKFGPPVTGWDETRAEAIRRSTNSSSGVNPKPRILLVTSSHPRKCDNKQGDQMLLKSIKNKMDYCRLHGIELYYNMDTIDDEMLGWWVKVFLTHMLMKQHPEVDWIWWMDSDAVFTDMSFELPLQKYANHNLVMSGWEDAVYEKRLWLGLNAGVYLLRNCQWSMDMLHAWAPMSPKGKIRDGVGHLLSMVIPDRPRGEVDDQAALVYLMLSDREKWGSKMFLESSYSFQGYWKYLTPKYEQMMETSKPGLYGDDRWPFVTHFTGCQFCCGSVNPEYTVDQCLTQMERAINFADNQIVELYGFRHKSLTSVEVVPTSTSGNVVVKN